jgi:hypothetical protein
MSGDSLPTNQEDREVYLREHNAANFIKTIPNAQGEQFDTVVMSLNAFLGEPDVLYVALNFARDAGMPVTMVPLTESTAA